MSSKLEKLQELLKLANDGLSKEDFLSAFKAVIEFVKKAEQNLTTVIDDKVTSAEQEVLQAKNRLSELEQTYQETLRQIEQDNQSTLSNLKKWALERVGELFIKGSIDQRVTKKLGEVDSKLAEFEGISSPDTASIAREAARMAQDALLPQLPTLEQFKLDIPKFGDEIRDALELLQGEERLDISAIKGLQEIIDGLKQLSQSRGIHALPTSGGGRIVKSYDLSPKLDGITNVFSLPAMWRIIEVKLFSKPVLQPTVDWVYDAVAHTLTFNAGVDPATDLAAGQTCLIIYGE